MQVTSDSKKISREIIENECIELQKYLKENKITLTSFCKINGLNYDTIQQRLTRNGIWLSKKYDNKVFKKRSKIEKSLNIGICRKASTINAFKELSLSCTGKTAGVILSEYVDRCLREGRVI